MDKKNAEMLAVQALGWIAQDTEIASGFLGMAGANPEDLRTRANDPEFLGFVLDYILSQDQYVLDFASFANVSPELPMRARASLPGGDLPNWT